MSKKRNVLSFFVGAIAVTLLAVGAVSLFIWGRANNIDKGIESNRPVSAFRLPTNVRPVSYNLTLVVYVPGFIKFDNPEKSQTFEGDVTIKVHVDEPTDRIELNAKELNITSVTVMDSSGKATKMINLEVVTNISKVLINLSDPLEVGRMYFIQISYFGSLSDRIYGFYSSSYDTSDGTTRYLATTLMPPTGARLMVPCFDEPSFKAVWRVQVIHPMGTNVISNALEQESYQKSQNWLSTQFSKTPLMSTYILAVVVSDFAYKEDYMKSSDGRDIRIRVWLRPDIIDESGWALECAKAILPFYERQFQIPFPIDKMDLVGVRDFPNGASESFGAILFHENFLRYNATLDHASVKLKIADIMAHELAHQWFGNVVTKYWWDDVFLSEGLASFMESLALGNLFNVSTTTNLINFTRVMVTGGFRDDQFSTAHPLHYDFVTPVEIVTNFDGIAYGKGASILRMIEKVIGTETFYSGIRIYLQDHKFGNADYKDLLRAFDKAIQASGTNKDFSVQKFADGWLTQANHPIVVARRIDETSVSLTQLPYILDFEITGDKIQRAWKIPIWYQVNGEEKDMAWLDDKPLTLQNIRKSDLLIINPQSIGYYYVQYDAELLQRVSSELLSNFTNLSPVARSRVLDDTFSLAHAGYVSYEGAFNLSNYLSQETESLPWTYVMNHINVISAYFAEEPESNIVDKFTSLMLDIKRNATREPFNTPGMSDNNTKDDPITSLKAFREQFLEPCSSTLNGISSKCSRVPTDLRESLYCDGVKYGIADFDYMVELYEREPQRQEKQNLLVALGCTVNTAEIKRLLRASLLGEYSPEIPIVHADDVVINIAQKNLVGRYVLFDFFLENFEQIYYRFADEAACKRLSRCYSTLNEIIKASLWDSSSQGIKTLESFLNDSNNDMHAVPEFNRQLLALKTKRHWIEKNLRNLSTFFTTQLSKNKRLN
ncbi:peptidase family m1 domain-containing protein [Ditylenchus destructor]|nr:peptidase family m1 domain-containing protein [Ditylenchus destructor]